MSLPAKNPVLISDLCGKDSKTYNYSWIIALQISPLNTLGKEKQGQRTSTAGNVKFLKWFNVILGRYILIEGVWENAEELSTVRVINK